MGAMNQRKNQKNSRVKTPVKRTGIIQPSSGSQSSIGQPINIIDNNPPKKQNNVPSESETKSQITPNTSKNKIKKTFKNPPTCSQSTLDHSSPQSNINFKGGIQSLTTSKNSFLNHIPDNKPQSTYKLLWRKKEECVSGGSLSNLQTHFDGSCQTLPDTSLQEIKTNTEKKEGLIYSHYNQAERFDKKESQ
ncbi:hypothetical protein VP01_2784g1 [Puccinia sorghi]|uniref:Uncharacterized protein n=1 Tax=Puccinia sorghi TaxID=27349 RepID=A0A0L6V2Q3_9BASI|nr:hypothetical protein VP01_2784g1 [Puccinia sorghi]